MSKKQQDEHNVRVMRSVGMIAVLTCGSTYFVVGDVHPPHGNPLVYASALSWLIAITLAFPSSIIFKNLSPWLFSLARWEKEGEIYDRWGIQAFRWLVLHSPLGWINPNIMRMSADQTDCYRLLREMNTAEGVHWLTCLASVMLAIRYFVDDHAVRGYSMLLVNIPFNLYPIMLQRWNRGRVSRVLRRRELRTLG